MTRIVLPKMNTQAGVDRAAAEISRILSLLDTRLRALEIATGIETDIARPPNRIGAVAVTGSDIYVATGLTPADWVQVN